MKPRPDGSRVKINPYDIMSEGRRPEEGDYVVTGAGTVYEIVSCYRVKHRKKLPSGVRARFNLTCEKLGRVTVPAGASVFPLEWYPRRKKRHE